MMIKAIKIRPNDSRVFYRGRRRLGTWHLPYHLRNPLTDARSHTFSKLPVNQRTLINIFRYLHSYAGHGIEIMRKRWKPAERRFERHHFAAGGKGSSQFLNTYTAHRWM